MTCTRPALRYMGGKWRLAPRIIQRMPPHRTYLEPFGGAASVLLRKARCFREIYNDLDGEVVNLFRVLRTPAQAAELARLVQLTPGARAEFEESYAPADDPVECARRTVVRSFMGFGSTAVALRRRTGFRALSEREGKPPQGDWLGMPAALLQISERLAGVVIENKPALPLMGLVDGENTLIFADPPYVHETRSRKRIKGALEHAYAHEMGNEQHAELLDWLADCKSMVMLSGYRSDLYDQKLKDWERCDMAAHADGGRPRTECLWINSAAQRAAGGLFAA